MSRGNKSGNKTSGARGGGRGTSRSGGATRGRSSSGQGTQRSPQRRSQSTTRRAGGISKGGKAEFAELLADSLRGARNDDVVAESLTHPLHTYPARMHPQTARALVGLCASQPLASRVLFDPFCGSGTTLVEGRAAGLPVVGTDLNPLAVRIARAKVWAPEKARLDHFQKVGKQISADAFAEGKAARRADYEPQPLRVVRGIDPKVRDEEVASWFAPHVRRELEFVASRIDEIRDEDQELADHLAVCLSAVLIKCSKRSSDTSSKEIRRNVARGAPSRWFGERVALLAAGLVDLYREEKQSGAIDSRVDAQVTQCDASQLHKAEIASESIGAIVTSPPYIGTYDYVDHHRLRLAFLGLPFDDFERREIGARRRFKGRAQQARDEAIDQFRSCLDGFHKVLVPGGLMALMVGDSVAGTEPVFADELLRDISGERFRLSAWASQKRDSLGRLEQRAFGDRGKREHVLLFEKR